MGKWVDHVYQIKEYLATIAGAVSGGKMLCDTELTANIDPTGLATSAKQLADGHGVVAGYKTKVITCAFVGMDATSQYDAVGALVEVPNWASAIGRGATLRKMSIEVANNAIAPQFEVHFFKASDVTVAADNVTWTTLAAEFAKRAGYVIMPACAKPTGSGTIDLVRAQSDDYGGSLDFQATCDSDKTSLWMKLKLLTSGISFAGTPGNAIKVIMEIEQS